MITHHLMVWDDGMTFDVELGANTCNAMVAGDCVKGRTECGDRHQCMDDTPENRAMLILLGYKESE